MRSHPIAPIGAPPGHLPGALSSVTHGGVPTQRRPWAAFVAAGAVGAVLAGGGVVALGVGERVVERPVTERVALTPTASVAGAPGAPAADAVRPPGEPAVVGIVAGDSGDDTRDIAGSGVVVRDDGIVVTSAALVTGAAAAVRLPDGGVTAAELVGADTTTGLAVLDMDGEGHEPSVLAPAADLTAGAATSALGAVPAGGVTTTAGIVGPARRYIGPGGNALDGIEITGGADPLALGGPVVNERGAVVGIVTAVDDDAAWYVAPVEVARHVTDGLLTDGAVDHGWLGIEGTEGSGTDPSGPDGSGTDLTGAQGPGTAVTTAATTADAPTEGTPGGVRVASVVPDSPADLGGLQHGDLIVALDGRPVAALPDLTVALRSRAPDERVDVTVVRGDGSRVTLVITLARAPSGG
ncbi:MAG: PDZ domain-containing protein [Acidimicrobiales bacterium]|nr:PDZ domain-containing protein [Acidimicrobiales bacterium]